MKKKIYQKPTTESIDTIQPQLMGNSPGWARDGEPPFKVEQEDEVDDDDKWPVSVDVWTEDDGYGGFLDLD